MRLLFLFFSICTLVTTASPQSTRQSLSVTAEGVEMQSCKNQPHLFTVYLRVHLTIQNDGNESVELYGMPTIERIQIAATKRDVDAGTFQYNPDAHEISSGSGNQSITGVSNTTNVKPRSVYEVSVWTGFVADLDETSAGMTAGDHVAKVWFTPGKGISSLSSKPFSIILKKRSRAPDCRSFRAPQL